MNLVIDRLTLKPRRFQRVGRRAICAWFLDGVGWRIFFAAPFQGRVKAYGIDQSVIMPARGILTIRPSTMHLVPYAINGDYSDFSGGGAMGIDPYGADADITVHDRVMQRCPVGRYDLDTGKQITTPVPGYHLSGGASLPPYKDPAWPFVEYDGEHRVRAYRFGLRHLSDPFVRNDLHALLQDSLLFWKPYSGQILAGPSGRGHGYVGRSWAWTTLLACTLRDPAQELLERVYEHVAVAGTGSPQRLENPATHGGTGFYGSPHPWTDSKVPAGIDVMQDFEQSHIICALNALGANGWAEKLADTVLARPLRKWIDCDTGLGVGTDYADPFQAWIGLGALARINRPKALEYAKRWPIPKPVWKGGSDGPYPTLEAQRAALVAAEMPGITRAFLEATK